jgi:hypothetical protein
MWGLLHPDYPRRPNEGKRRVALDRLLGHKSPHRIGWSQPSGYDRQTEVDFSKSSVLW